MIVYIVEALRYGDREKHSYIAGVFDNVEAANNAAKAEEVWRAGKYECVVFAHGVNTNADPEKLEYAGLNSLDKGQS